MAWYDGGLARLRLQTVPTPAWDRWVARDHRVRWRIGGHVVHCPAHVRADGRAEVGIGRQLRVVESGFEATNETLAQISHAPVARVHVQDVVLGAATLREEGWAAHHLGPVRGE